jgi:hypothetical protein
VTTAHMGEVSRMFGDPVIFAVEVKVMPSGSPLSKRNNPVIELHYWINGARRGGGNAYLEDLAWCMRYLRTDCGNRQFDLALAHEPRQVFVVMNAVTHDRLSIVSPLTASLPVDFKKFSLWFHPIFHENVYFLFDHGIKSRLIYGQYDADTERYDGCVTESIEKFEAPLLEMCDFISKILDRS